MKAILKWKGLKTQGQEDNNGNNDAEKRIKGQSVIVRTVDSGQ